MLQDIETFSDHKAIRYFDIFGSINPEQISVSVIPKAGTLNVWHRHRAQTDWMVVVRGALEIYTLTAAKTLDKYILKDSAPRCLTILPGLYHGWKSLEDNTVLIYCLSHKHDDDDEERVSYEKMRVPL